MYEYECKSCGQVLDTNIRQDAIGCGCGGRLQRRWSVNRSKGVPAHYNFSLGQYVKSDRDFDEKLKIAGETAGTTFSRLDPGDAPRPSTDDGIFDTQMRTLTDKGFVGADGKVSIDGAGRFVPKSSP